MAGMMSGLLKWYNYCAFGQVPTSDTPLTGVEQQLTLIVPTFRYLT
jgi:hypothetical protein